MGTEVEHAAVGPDSLAAVQNLQLDDLVRQHPGGSVDGLGTKALKLELALARLTKRRRIGESDKAGRSSGNDDGR